MIPAATADAPAWNRRLHGSGSSGDVRTSYGVDRDRIIHCQTFRELQHKTQVQSLLTGSLSARTRLNHVIEVAQIARGLAVEIGANEPLSEAIALAHDLGHPPFGHAGERALRDTLAERGRESWNANVHSLAVVDEFECAFVSFRGIDLTWATREGIARHSTPFDEPVSFGEFTETPNGGLECQIVDAADVLAYLSHDLDDALAGDYIDIEELPPISPILRDLVARATRRWTEQERPVWPAEERALLVRRQVIAQLIGRAIRDLAEQCAEAVERLGLESPDEIRARRERVVAHSPSHAEATRALLDLLVTRYYRSAAVRDADEQAAVLVRELVAALLAEPDRVPARFRGGDEVVAVAAYVASLNDRSAVVLAQNFGLTAAPEALAPIRPAPA